MNPVSFKSVYNIYTVSSDINKMNEGHKILEKYCDEHCIRTKTKYNIRPVPANFLGRNEKIFCTTFISSPRENDHKIDMICNNYRIKHKKISDKGTYIKTWTDNIPILDRISTYLGLI